MESFPPKLVKLWSEMVQQITTQRLQNMESFPPKLVQLWSGMVQQITTQRLQNMKSFPLEPVTLWSQMVTTQYHLPTYFKDRVVQYFQNEIVACTVSLNHITNFRQLFIALRSNNYNTEWCAWQFLLTATYIGNGPISKQIWVY